MYKLPFPTWVIIVILGLLLGTALAGYLSGSGAGAGRLPQRRVRALRAQISQHLRQVAADTLRAHRAATQGRQYYAAGQAADRRAQALHHLTHRAHVTPRPPADTAAQRLQRLLSAY